jgi:hypothetical protein
MANDTYGGAASVHGLGGLLSGFMRGYETARQRKQDDEDRRSAIADKSEADKEHGQDRATADSNAKQARFKEAYDFAQTVEADPRYSPEHRRQAFAILYPEHKYEQMSPGLRSGTPTPEQQLDFTLKAQGANGTTNAGDSAQNNYNNFYGLNPAASGQGQAPAPALQPQQTPAPAAQAPVANPGSIPAPFPSIGVSAKTALAQGSQGLKATKEQVDALQKTVKTWQGLRTYHMPGTTLAPLLTPGLRAAGWKGDDKDLPGILDSVSTMSEKDQEGVLTKLIPYLSNSGVQQVVGRVAGEQPTTGKQLPPISQGATSTTGNAKLGSGDKGAARADAKVQHGIVNAQNAQKIAQTQQRIGIEGQRVHAAASKATAAMQKAAKGGATPAQVNTILKTAHGIVVQREKMIDGLGSTLLSDDEKATKTKAWQGEIDYWKKVEDTAKKQMAIQLRPSAAKRYEGWAKNTLTKAKNQRFAAGKVGPALRTSLQSDYHLSKAQAATEADRLMESYLNR